MGGLWVKYTCLKIKGIINIPCSICIHTFSEPVLLNTWEKEDPQPVNCFNYKERAGTLNQPFRGNQKKESWFNQKSKHKIMGVTTERYLPQPCSPLTTLIRWRS